MKRILLLVPTTTYRAADLLRAASRLGVEVTVGSDRRQALETQTDDTTLTLAFADIAASLERVRRAHERHPFAAVLGVDDETVLVAADLAEALGLPHNPRSAVLRTRDKLAFRAMQAQAGLPHPRFLTMDAATGAPEAIEELGYPCVLKPTSLSASRGVIRVDTPEQAREAIARIGAILRDPEARERSGDRADTILAEEYLPGAEMSVEAILRSGDLAPLALFDKPDPLEGPYFEESLFITPTRQPAAVIAEVLEAVQRSVTAIGLREGPVHAEVRLTPRGPILLEIAARSIGGLCPRALRFTGDRSLEEIVLLHALGQETGGFSREASAAGVMMIPIPRAGYLAGIEGLDEARAVRGISEITLSMHVGDQLVPLPEGNRYLGFIFGRAGSPEQVEAALRQAHTALTFDVEPSRA